MESIIDKLKKVGTLTRREFIKYCAVVAAALLAACTNSVPPPTIISENTSLKEKQPLEKNFMLFASSTGLDIGCRLNGEPLYTMDSGIERSWELVDQVKKTAAYVHAKSGARFQDVIQMIQNDNVSNQNAKDVFIIVGGNEITSSIRGDELEKEAEKIVDVAVVVNRKYAGKNVHFILPPPTLLDQYDPNFCYEERRKIFNPALVRSLQLASSSGIINNIQPPIYLDDLVTDQFVFRDSRHFTAPVVDNVIRRIYQNIH